MSCSSETSSSLDSFASDFLLASSSVIELAFAYVLAAIFGFSMSAQCFNPGLSANLSCDVSISLLSE
jgi:hypothetical protein